MNVTDLNELTRQALSKRFLWLFLDYDGTLSDFTPTPEMVDPDQQICDLLSRLSSQPGIRLAVISGRRLHDIQALLPVKGIYLAGTYGIELLMPDGTLIQRVELDAIQPFLENVKPKWMEIIAGEQGFYLEDKNWALALHAKLGSDEDARRVLTLAREIVERELPEEQFRILGGHKFLEAAPLLAHKGRTVSYLLEKYPLPNPQMLYIGDDDKDEEAFEIINTHGGIAIKVISEAQSSQPTRAQYTLESPAAVHAWLETLLTKLKETK
ncbi:MAG: trehalose-phosphatase [Chloroflexota bacterium]